MTKKLLFLTPALPYPPVSGGVIKSNKTVRFLAEHCSVSVACFLKNDDNLYRDEFLRSLNLENDYMEELNIPRSAKNLILSNLKGIPLNLYRNASASFAKKIKAWIHDFDVVFCDHYVMFQYIPDDFRGKIVLHEHNCEYLIWQRYADVEPRFFKRLALLNQAWRIKNYERQICNRSDAILAAPNDTDELVKIGADRSKFFETYHLGDDATLALPSLKFDYTEKALLYIGTLSWEANIDGLLWFYREVWKRLVAQEPDLKLYIIGKHADKRLLALQALDARIILTGFVEDLEPYFQKCRVFITPLRFGSGIKVKVVNSLYRGIPCVTTTIGVEGLKVTDGKDILVRDNPRQQADAIIELLHNKAQWESISTNARILAKEFYTWEAVLENIQKAVEA